MQILHVLRLVYEDQNKAHATKVPMLSKMELNLDQLEIQLRKEKIIKNINYLKNMIEGTSIPKLAIVKIGI